MSDKAWLEAFPALQAMPAERSQRLNADAREVSLKAGTIFGRISF